MLAKITSKNQVTIPKKIIDQIPETQYFEVGFKNGIILLKPLKIYGTNLELIRLKMKKLGLKQNSVAEAIKWAREK
ncbi:MAG: hypothetical protein WBM69_28690 [Desulfobacterales bacterium]